ncbi:hypothetical protein ACA910_000987 [Epithemia clementina (nom. ined.)]
MGMAIREAQSAAERGEVPVGAVVVRNHTQSSWTKDNQQPTIIPTTQPRPFDNNIQFEVLSYGSNHVEQHMDASAHAELLALRDASRAIANWRLYNTTLYTTLEPCPMCLAAAQAFRIDSIVYGAPDLRLGAVSTHMNLIDVAPHPFHTISHIVSGVRQKECAHLLQSFFRQRRRRMASSRAK